MCSARRALSAERPPTMCGGKDAAMSGVSICSTSRSATISAPSSHVLHEEPVLGGHGEVHVVHGCVGGERVALQLLVQQEDGRGGGAARAAR